MNAPLAVFPNPNNFAVLEMASGLAAAIEAVDALGISVIKVEAHRRRNRLVHVAYTPACDRLDAVVVRRGSGYECWAAHLDGVEVRWLRSRQS